MLKAPSCTLGSSRYLQRLRTYILLRRASRQLARPYRLRARCQQRRLQTPAAAASKAPRLRGSPSAIPVVVPVSLAGAGTDDRFPRRKPAARRLPSTRPTPTDPLPTSSPATSSSSCSTWTVPSRFAPPVRSTSTELTAKLDSMPKALAPRPTSHPTLLHSTPMETTPRKSSTISEDSPSGPFRQPSGPQQRRSSPRYARWKASTASANRTTCGSPTATASSARLVPGVMIFHEGRPRDLHEHPARRRGPCAPYPERRQHRSFHRPRRPALWHPPLLSA